MKAPEMAEDSLIDLLNIIKTSWLASEIWERFKAPIAFLIHSFLLVTLPLLVILYLFRILCLKNEFHFSAFAWLHCRNLQAGAMTSAASSPSLGFTLKRENMLKSYWRRCKRCTTRETPIQHILWEVTSKLISDAKPQRPTNWQVWCGCVWGWGKDASTLLYAWSPTSSEPMLSSNKRILTKCNEMITWLNMPI